MRLLLMTALFLSLVSCVQDVGKIDSASVSDDSSGSTGSTSGGTSGGSSTTHDDPLYEYQWHLNNTGQDVGSYVKISDGIDTTPTSGIDINAEEVHDDGDGYTGAGVTIAVSDTGVDYNHPDLNDNFIAAGMRNYTFVDPARWDLDADAYPSGNEPHGTAVSGIISMEGWNGIGGRGVAPGSTFTGFKFILDYAALDHLSSYEDKLIHQADGDYDIFNYSYGFSQCFFYDDFDDDLRDAFSDGVTNLRSGKGAIYVQSAGNSFYDSYCGDDSSRTYYYGNTNATASLSFPEKIITAAVSADGVKSSYSTPGSGVWVSGLGGEGMQDVDPTNVTNIQYVPAIYTTDIQDCSSGFGYREFIYKLKNPFNYGYDTTLNATCDYTNIMNGTSSAAPIVSGVVALMLEANPALTWREVKYILATTAQMVDYDAFDNELEHPDGVSTYTGYVYDYKWVLNNAPSPVFFSNWYGFGLVDAQAAVSTAASWTPGSLGTYVKTETAGVWDHTDSTIVPIPEGDMTLYGESTIAGVASLTIEAVQVRLSTDHPNPEQLAVHLISPSGTESRLVLVDSGIVSGGSTDFYFLSNAFLNEDSGGTWTIRVYDPEDIPTNGSLYTADTGNITGWGINIHGR